MATTALIISVQIIHKYVLNVPWEFHQHSFKSPLANFITADARQPWTDYLNTQNEYLIIEAVVCFDYSNIHYLHFKVCSKSCFGHNHSFLVQKSSYYFQ